MIRQTCRLVMVRLELGVGHIQLPILIITKHQTESVRYERKLLIIALMLQEYQSMQDMVRYDSVK